MADGIKFGVLRVNLASCCSEQAGSVLRAETISLRTHKTFCNNHDIITQPVTHKTGHIFTVTIASVNGFFF
jgi:hypothetical protein